MNDTSAELNWRASFGPNNGLTLTCPVNVSAGPSVAGGLRRARSAYVAFGAGRDSLPQPQRHGCGEHSGHGKTFFSFLFLLTCASDDFERDIEAVGVIFHERQLVTVEAAEAYDVVPVADVAVVEDQIL